MTYPPQWRNNGEAGDARRLIERYPFAHLFSSQKGLHATRTPFVADFDGSVLTGLRGHLNRLNPQVVALDGAEVLIVFSGPSAYVSPHWRSEKTRAGTYDYEEVRVRGTARLVGDMTFFTTLIDDLSALIEPQHAEVGSYPVWRTATAPEGYIERLFPHITAFTITVDSVEMISKLHQQFPHEDRQSIVVHLRRSHREDSRLIAERIAAVDA